MLSNRTRRQRRAQQRRGRKEAPDKKKETLTLTEKDVLVLGHIMIYLFASHGMIIIGFTEELRSSTYNQVLQKCLKCDRCKFTFFLQSRNDQVIKMINNKEECSSAIKLTTKTPPMLTTLRADALVGSMSVFGHT